MAAGFDYGAHIFTEYLSEGQNYYENGVHSIDASKTGLEGFLTNGNFEQAPDLLNLQKIVIIGTYSLPTCYSVNATQAVEDLPRGIDNPTQLIASFNKKELNVYQASWSSRCISLEVDVVVVTMQEPGRLPEVNSEGLIAVEPFYHLGQEASKERKWCSDEIATRFPEFDLSVKQ
ncbi:hypothetical protein Tco_0105356 [Tanacetum coccineum]